jgi:hypothetical protein
LFVPFLVGTWLTMLIVITTGFFGLYIDSRSSKLS